MDKFIIPIIKSLVFLYEEAHSSTAAGSVILPDERTISLWLSKEHNVASMFIAGLKEDTTTEEISPTVSIHLSVESGNLCRITIVGVNEFICDWHNSGGVRSILPLLRRFAGRY